MFWLSTLVVLVTIASLGFINLFGIYGFALVVLIPVIVFLIGSYFVPLDHVG